LGGDHKKQNKEGTTTGFKTYGLDDGVAGGGVTVPGNDTGGLSGSSNITDVSSDVVAYLIHT